MKTPRQLLTAVFVVLLTAGISLADGTFPEDPVNGCEDATGVTGVTGESGVVAEVDETTGPSGATGVTGPTGEDCEEPEPTGETGGDGEDPEDGEENGDEPVNGDREAECLAAADMTTDNGDGEDGDGDGEDGVTGLDTAIAHVLANCLKNPQAPGLLRALDQLTDNRDRHNVHGPTKAAEARAKGQAASEAGGPPWQTDGGGPGNGHGVGNPHG